MAQTGRGLSPRARRTKVATVVAAVVAIASALVLAGLGPLRPATTDASLLSGSGRASGTFDGVSPGTVSAAFLDGQGRLVVAGAAHVPGYSNMRFALGRHTLPYGLVDPTLGGDGNVVVDTPHEQAGFATVGTAGAVVDDQDRVVFAGHDWHDAFVGRLLADGTLDPTFGADGIAVIEHGDAFFDRERPQAITLDGNAVVIAGDAWSRTGDDAFVARVDSNGTPDPTFGTGGVVTMGGVDNQQAHSVVVVGGDIVLAGCTDTGVVSPGIVGAASQWFLARLDPNGVPEASFGDGGMMHVGADVGWAQASATAVVADGSDLFVAGTVRRDAVVAKFDATGAFDPTFGGAGGAPGWRGFDTAAWWHGDSSDAPTGVLVDGSTLVVAGIANPWGAAYNGFVAEFALATGDPIASFGSNGDGIVGGASLPPASALVAIGGGTYALVGVAPPTGYSIALVDGATGALVTSFGVPGTPRDVTAVAGAAQATVSWTRPDDTGGLAVNAFVVTSDQGNVVEVGPDATSAVVSGLTPGVPYSFFVAARSPAGVGVAAWSSSVVPTVPPTTTTTAPRPVPPVRAILVRTGPVVLRSGRLVKVANGTPPRTAIVAAAQTGTGRGAWTVTRAGRVYTSGDARSAGSVPAAAPDRTVDLGVTASGRGYWLPQSDGRIYVFGDARGYGSWARPARPVVAMEVSPSGRGYLLLASNGDVARFGDARGYGGAARLRVLDPFVAIARTPTGKGYWLVTRPGRVYPFGDARVYGSTPRGLTVAAIVSSASGHGYWLVTVDGRVLHFGDAH